MGTSVLYVSCADSGEIAIFGLDDAGALAPLQRLAVGPQAMPMAVGPDRRFLYVALRSPPYAVVSMAIDARDGRLAIIGTAPLPDSMAHLALDRLGRTLFAASYPGHKLSVSPIGDDGVAGAPVNVLPTGRNPHAILVDPSNRHVFVTQLGDDALMALRFDAASRQIVPDRSRTWVARPGAGPRHLVLHPRGRFVYVLNETDATVDVLAFDPEAGTLTLAQTVSSLTEAFAGQPWAADIHVRSDGRFLYTSERTSSTLATFAVSDDGDRLTLLGHAATEAQPRGFGIDPSGRWLVAVGQRSHGLTLYAVDAASGRLEPRLTQAVGRNPNWVEIASLS